MNKHFISKENFHFNPKELVQSGFGSDELVLYVPQNQNNPVVKEGAILSKSFVSIQV